MFNNIQLDESDIEVEFIISLTTTHSIILLDLFVAAWVIVPLYYSLHLFIAALSAV